MAGKDVATTAAAAGSAFVEMGATGIRQYGGYVREEFLPELSGWRGMRMLREMRDNDAIIGAVFFLLDMVLRGVDFSFKPADENNPDDVEAAAFLTSCLADMEMSWPEIISEILTFLPFGWFVSEIVYKMRQGNSGDPRTRSQYNDGMIGWRKFAGRAQETLLRWDFDMAGTPIAMIQILPTGGPLLRVPLSKCLHFRTRLVKNNPEGVSIMRNAYVSYYYGKRMQQIEAIGIERDMSGLPIAWVPPVIMSTAANKDQKAQLATIKNMVRDTNRGEQEGYVFPLTYDDKGNKLYDFTLLTTGGRRQIDTSEIIDRYDHRKAATMAADFIVLGQGASAGRGSYAQSENKTDLWQVAGGGFLDLITGEFNRKAIPDLLTMNALPGKAMMTHGDIGGTDLAVLGEFLAKMTANAIITPTPELEATVLRAAGMPVPDLSEDTSVNEGGAQGTGSDNDPAADPVVDPLLGQGQGTRGATAAQPFRLGKRKRKGK